jgi:hypothetical protein
MERKYEEGDRFKAIEEGVIEIVEKPEVVRKFDYYVSFLSPMRPDKIGYSEYELSGLEKIEN